MKKFSIIFVFIFIIHPWLGFSQVQVKADLKKIEDSLKILAKVIINGETDIIKYNANERFLKLMEGALVSENSFDYPFDSLVTIAIQKSDDKKFRIFSWNIRKSDGDYEYFGFLQALNDKQSKYMLYRLTDNSATIITPEMKVLDPLYWYGALYYKIILNKSKGKKFYTLLGWNGHNNITQKKIIDVISFTSNDNPVFGAAIFKYNRKLYKRIIFEYSSTTSMSVKYDRQYITTGRKKRTMIVFDRLAPLDKSMQGMYQYYYPETNIFDAFIFKKGKWNFEKDIDARSAPPTKEERKHSKQILKEQKEHRTPAPGKIIEFPYFAH